MRLNRNFVLVPLLTVVITSGLLFGAARLFMPWLFEKPAMIPGCTPHPAGVFEDDLFHHTPGRCVTWTDTEYIKEGELRKAEYDVTVRTNSLGFRNKEYPLEKGTAKRVVLMGDSFAYGFGLPDEHTIFTRLEEKLKSPQHPDVQVWSVSNISWSPAIHYVVTKRKISAYSPDLVVLLLDESDFTDDAQTERNAVYENGELMAVRGGLPSLLPDLLGKGSDEIYDEIWSDPKTAPAKLHALEDVTLGFVERMARFLETKKINFLVVFYPYPDTKNDYYEQYVTRMIRELQSRKVRVLDLFPSLSEPVRKQYYFTHNLHWNEAGSVFVAEMIAEHIRKEQLLP
jgi:lysophospholipase L1-like esterase